MNYRLLRVDSDGTVSKVVIVDVPDDQTARLRARDLSGYGTVEIWCGTRQVAFKTAGPAAASEPGS